MNCQKVTFENIKTKTKENAKYSGYIKKRFLFYDVAVTNAKMNKQLEPVLKIIHSL